MSDLTPHREFDDLMDALLDDVIGDADYARLVALMRRDRDLLKEYYEVMAVDADLTLELSTVQVDYAEPAEVVEVVASEPTLVYRGANRHPRHKKSAVPYVVSALAAAIAIACGVAIYVVALTPEEVVPERDTKPIATLIEKSGGELSTPGGFISEGRQYTAGNYAIDDGHAQFVLTNRVTVDLRGTTNLYMHSDRSVFLSRGNAEFRVPKDATGFTVHLPDKSKIVDLGTAFAIEIGEDGEVDCVVTEGRVAWFDAKPDAQPVYIDAGQRIHVADGLHAVHGEPKPAGPIVTNPPVDPAKPADVVWGDPVAIKIVNPSFEDGAKGWSDKMGGVKLTRTAEEFGYAAPDGDHAIFAFGGIHQTTQVLTATLEANTRYTLQMDFLRRGDDEGPIHSMFVLGVGTEDDAIELAQIRNGAAAATIPDAPGKFTTWTLTFETGAAPEGLGQPLWIRLGASGKSTIGSAGYDNVRLTAAAALPPENAPNDEPQNTNPDEKPDTVGRDGN